MHIDVEKSVGATELHYSSKKREHCMLKECSQLSELK